MNGISFQDFIEVWETAPSAKEAAAQLGISSKSASSRANYLRSKGLKLRKFNVTCQGQDLIEAKKLLRKIQALRKSEQS